MTRTIAAIIVLAVDERSIAADSSYFIDSRRGSVFLDGFHEHRWCQWKDCQEDASRGLKLVPRLWPTVLESYTPTDRCAAVLERDELVGFHRGRKGLCSVRERGPAISEVAQRHQRIVAQAPGAKAADGTNSFSTARKAESSRKFKIHGKFKLDSGKRLLNISILKHKSQSFQD